VSEASPIAQSLPGDISLKDLASEADWFDVSKSPGADRRKYNATGGKIHGDPRSNWPRFEVHRPFSLWKSLLGLLAALTLMMGPFVAWCSRPVPRDAVFFVVTLVLIFAGSIAGLYAMAYIMPRQDVTVRTAEGRLFITVLDDQRVSLWTSPFTVLDDRRAIIGMVLRTSGGARTTYQVVDATGATLCTAKEESKGKALARMLIAGAIHGGGAVEAGARVTYLIRNPERQPVGEVIRNAHGQGTSWINLAGDPARQIDRRLALALAIKVNFALKG
jgi:hypothetical protein